MKAFNNYDEAKKSAEAQGSSAKLPEGAYVCKISAVRYETTEWGDRIALAFDICEGEYKGFFQKQFDANTSEDKKWKGKTNVFVPKDDGSEKDAITKKSFASWTSAFEKSNPGYTWDWNENKWKNKIIGIVYGETGTVIDGKEIVYTEARFPIEVERVRSGNAPKAKFKAKNGYTGNQTESKPAAASSASADEFMNVPEGGPEEIPF